MVSESGVVWEDDVACVEGTTGNVLLCSIPEYILIFSEEASVENEVDPVLLLRDI